MVPNLLGLLGLQWVAAASPAVDFVPKPFEPLEQLEQTDTTVPVKKSTAKPLDPTTIVEPDTALKYGFSRKENGDLVGAAAGFRRVLQLSKDDQEDYQAAQAELDFHLPVLEARRLVVVGQAKLAVQVLLTALSRNRKQAERVRQLNDMLRQVQLLVSTQGENTEFSATDVAQRVRSLLSNYQRQYRHYPRNYRELNQLLPPDRFPLRYFNVVLYRSNGAGYHFELRNKANPDQIVRISNTGPLR